MEAELQHERQSVTAAAPFYQPPQLWAEFVLVFLSALLFGLIGLCLLYP